MKSKKIRILILMIVLVAIGTIGYFLFASEKDDVLIRRRFSELSETVRKTGNEGLLVSLEKARPHPGSSTITAHSNWSRSRRGSA